MRLRLTWSPAVHEVAHAVAFLLALAAAAALVAAWLLWQQAGHLQRQGLALKQRVQSLAVAHPAQQAPQQGLLQAPSLSDMAALRERLQPIRREHAARDWTANDWLDLLARDMPASVHLTTFQHGPDPASVSFTAQSDDAASLSGWLLHMEAHRSFRQVSVLRQDSRARQGTPVVSMDVRIQR